MGVIIRKKAAAPDILADVKETLAVAAAREGIWNEEALRVLAPSALRAFESDLSLTSTEETLALAQIRVEGAVRELDLAYGNARDVLWNLLDRPADHPELTILPLLSEFTALVPGDKPVWIEAIALMLEQGTLTEIPLARCVEIGAELRVPAVTLTAAVSAHEGIRKQNTLSSVLRKGYVQSARLQLVNLKRVYKSRGKSEADIHRVIPDRKSRPVAAAPPPSQAVGAPTPPSADEAPSEAAEQAAEQAAQAAEQQPAEDVRGS